MNKSIRSVLSVIGGISAFLTIALMALLFVNAQWPFLPANIVGILNVINKWSVLVVVAITGLEFCWGRTILFLIFAIVVAICVIFMFFPNVVGMIKG